MGKRRGNGEVRSGKLIDFKHDRVFVDWIRWPEQDEVVPHDVAPFGPVARGHERVLALARMHEHDVHVAARPELERLAGSDRDDIDLDPLAFPELLEDVRDQPGILGARRRRQPDARSTIRGAAGGEERQNNKERQSHGPRILHLPRPPGRGQVEQADAGEGPCVVPYHA